MFPFSRFLQVYTIMDTLLHSVRLCNCIADYLNIRVFKITPIPIAAAATAAAALAPSSSISQRTPDSDEPITLKSLAEDGPGRSIRRLVRRVRTLYRRYRAKRSGSVGDDEAEDSSPDTRRPGSSGRVLTATGGSMAAAAGPSKSPTGPSTTFEPSDKSTAFSSNESGHASASDFSASDASMQKADRTSAQERRISRKSKL